MKISFLLFSAILLGEFSNIFTATQWQKLLVLRTSKYLRAFSASSVLSFERSQFRALSVSSALSFERSQLRALNILSFERSQLRALSASSVLSFELSQLRAFSASSVLIFGCPHMQQFLPLCNGTYSKAWRKYRDATLETRYSS